MANRVTCTEKALRCKGLFYNELFFLLLVALKALSMGSGFLFLQGHFLVTPFAIQMIGRLEPHGLVLNF